MSSVLEFSIILLIFVLIAAIATVSVYLVKLLIELKVLAKNANETTVMINEEIKPLIKEAKTSMEKVNAIIKTAEGQVNTLKKLVTTILGFSTLLVGGFSKVSGGFFKGFQTAFNLFRRK